jgi:hypothetical protein
MPAELLMISDRVCLRRLVGCWSSVVSPVLLDVQAGVRLGVLLDRDTQEDVLLGLTVQHRPAVRTRSGATTDPFLGIPWWEDVVTPIAWAASMGESIMRVQSGLTQRDLVLLGWLADHGVLTTEQIAAGLFPSTNFAQRRLRELMSKQLVDRFRPQRPDGGSYPYH